MTWVEVAVLLWHSVVRAVTQPARVETASPPADWVDPLYSVAAKVAFYPLGPYGMAQSPLYIHEFDPTAMPPWPNDLKVYFTAMHNGTGLGTWERTYRIQLVHGIQTIYEADKVSTKDLPNHIWEALIKFQSGEVLQEVAAIRKIAAQGSTPRTEPAP